MTQREIFKNNLVNLIRMTKVTQVDIAKYAEVSYKTVSAWVTGRGYPRADTMEKLCRFFGVKQSALTEEQKGTDEDKLLSAFMALSPIGRQKLLDYADDLIRIYPKGKK